MQLIDCAKFDANKSFKFASGLRPYAGRAKSAPLNSALCPVRIRMESIYNIVKDNPEFFTWVFGIVNFLWGAFLYFNKKSHDKEIEKLKSNLKIQEAEVLPIIAKLQELEDLAGEAKEVATSYRTTEQKKEYHLPVYDQLNTFAGHFSKYPSLMQAIRDLNQYCAIMAAGNPHDSCREEVVEFYNVLLTESENVRNIIKA